nr:hypothetical protein [Bradyrhizobium sp. ORS 278]
MNRWQVAAADHPCYVFVAMGAAACPRYILKHRRAWTQAPDHRRAVIEKP